MDGVLRLVALSCFGQRLTRGNSIVVSYPIFLVTGFDPLARVTLHTSRTKKTEKELRVAQRS